ncbi:hypothetical protein NM688_g1852 [Phlebia brevispora]|uniref:Uncharacterized protein n=1 Tax=Phlebia brevispora TaxID=194682 RepID=A0ACC1TAC0_9APHY|nr:hypothetical protein NM688_g1852 [Phlebia brevispora]
MVTLNLNPKVWFITGTSSGFGLHLVQTALARGDRVIATARSLPAIRYLESPNCRVLQLDVTSGPEVLQQKAQEAVNFWGKVDVLVNNAGFAGLGICEEAKTSGFLKQFSANFFGVIDLNNAFLPHMRNRKSGTIVIVGSRHAWKTQHPMTGAYSASKAAVHAYGEGLSTELAPFNIRVLLVQPGAHRTAGIPNMFKNSLAGDGDAIRDYDGMRTLGNARFRAQEGKQGGDAVKAAEAIADVVRGEGRAAGRPFPLWLVLGKDAEDDLRANLKQRLQNLDEWQDVTRSTTIETQDSIVLI